LTQACSRAAPADRRPDQGHPALDCRASSLGMVLLPVHRPSCTSRPFIAAHRRIYAAGRHGDMRPSGIAVAGPGLRRRAA
jgi:hypothetical protein